MSETFRSDNRKPEQMRPVRIEPDFIATAEGSALIEIGNTRVICTASIEESVPSFLRNSGRGWITAEYGMLPRATLTRSPREAAKGRIGGRTHEIQRLIGRSLRAVTDFAVMGEMQVVVDCDVLQADGGTRTASISGAYVALHDAFSRMEKLGRVKAHPLTAACGAVSVGIVEAVSLLDLDYSEDVGAEVDMNVVMTSEGRFVEVQGTAEGMPFTRIELDDLLGLAEHGIAQILDAQAQALAEAPPVRSP